MSWHAVRWAIKLQIKPSSAKSVLIALAYDERDNGMAWPSIARLEAHTGLDRKTIITSLQRLEARGILKDDGQRRGSTGQVKVFRFIGLETVPKAGRLKEPYPGQKEFRFFQQTVPNSGYGEVQGELKERTAPAGAKLTKLPTSAAAARYSLPQKLNGEEQRAASQYLEHHPQAQLVLDELAGILQKKKLDNPLGMLRKLADQAKRGELMPSHAPRIEAERELEQVQSEVQTAKAAGRHA